LETARKAAEKTIDAQHGAGRRGLVQMSRGGDIVPAKCGRKETQKKKRGENKGKDKGCFGETGSRGGEGVHGL